MIAQLTSFLNDNDGKLIICPDNKKGTFICIVTTGDLTWQLNGTEVFQFFMDPSLDTMGMNRFGAASVLKNENGKLTSVMYLDAFPENDLIVQCNNFETSIEHLGTYYIILECHYSVLLFRLA